MGICVARWSEAAGFGSPPRQKILIADHDGNQLYFAVPTGMSTPGPYIVTDPVAEKAYVHDSSATKKDIITVLDLSSGNEGDVLDSYNWGSLWGDDVALRFRTITDGGYLIGTNLTTGDGKVYILKDDFSEQYSYQIAGKGSTVRFIDLKITPDKAHLYLLNDTNSQIHKYPINEIRDISKKISTDPAPTFADFLGLCVWTTTPDVKPRLLGIDTTAGDVIVTAYTTNSTDVSMYRLSGGTGAVVWTQDSYGWRVPALDVANGQVYVGTGDDGGTGATYGLQVGYDDGITDSEIENDALNPSKVNDAALAHDNSGVVFFGGYSGNNTARLWAADVATFTLQWGIESGVNPGVDLIGDPTGYHYQQMADEAADEPNWAHPSPILDVTKNFRDGVLTIKGKTSDGNVHHTVVLDQGDLMWVETQEVIEVLDRGDLSHLRKGDEHRVDVGFMLKYQNLQADTATTTYEAIKQVGAASTWNNLDSNDIYTISLVFDVYDVDNYIEETIVFNRFFWESIEFHEGSDYNTLLVTGGSFQISLSIQ